MSPPPLYAKGAHVETSQLIRPDVVLRKAPSGHGLTFKLAAGIHGLFTRAPSLVTGLVSLAEFEAPVMNQAQTGSCEGHRASQGLAVASNAVGKPLPWVASPDAAYRAARCVQRVAVNGVLPALTDSGCATVEMLTALASTGLSAIRADFATTGPDAFTDVDVATVNREPRLDELEEEALTLVTGEYAIDLGDTGAAIATIQAALAQKWPVWIDAIVGSNFQSWGAEWTPGEPALDSGEADDDPNKGGHAVLITEVFVSSSGVVTLSGVNSWGVAWGAPPLDGGAANRSGHFQVGANWFSSQVYGATVGRIQGVSP